MACTKIKPGLQVFLCDRYPVDTFFIRCLLDVLVVAVRGGAEPQPVIGQVLRRHAPLGERVVEDLVNATTHKTEVISQRFFSTYLAIFAYT